MDFTDLRQKLGALVVEYLDLREYPRGRDAAIAHALKVRNAVDDFRDLLDETDDKADKLLAEAGIDTKRCAKCQQWMVVSNVGRPRVYCTDECRSAARTVRS